MTAALDLVVRAGAAGFADSLLIGFAVAAIVWAILGLLRRHRASTRFVVLAAAMASMAVLPLARAFAHGQTGPASAPLIHLGDAWTVWVATLWAVGASIGLLRLAIGMATLRRMRRTARPLALPPELLDTVQEFSAARPIEFLVSDSVPAPCAIGFFRPAVIMPAWILDEISASELRHVFIHELSHLQRRDDWTNLFQRLVRAVFFFHPAVWWMEGRLSLEREMACDDAVLAHASSPRAYAECLARLAERSVLRRGLALAQAAVSRMRQTSRRVARILRFDGAVRGSRIAVSAATVFALTGFGALLNAPTLISFSTSAPVALASSRQASPVALASSRQFRRHPAGSLNAVNASFSTASSHSSSPAGNTPRANPSSTQRAAHSVDAIAKHAAPAPAVVQASLRNGYVGRVTYVVVVQDENTFAVWQISTWHYVPAQQAAQHKTT